MSEDKNKDSLSLPVVPDSLVLLALSELLGDCSRYPGGQGEGVAVLGWVASGFPTVFRGM